MSGDHPQPGVTDRDHLGGTPLPQISGETMPGGIATANRTTRSCPA
jgi:hypothetical protein